MIIFASDFDNTLFYHQGENGYSRKEDIEKIEQFQAVGNLFGLCTGRALFDVFFDAQDIIDFIDDGADVILLPELGYDIDKVNEAILDRARRGKPYSIVVVAEGIETPDKKRPSDYITRAIEAGTGIETRDTVLGYTQRGGNPSPFDRNLATRLGGHATELIATGEFGRMVCMKGDTVESIPLSEVAGKLKLVTPDHDLIVQGKRMGVTLGT